MAKGNPQNLISNEVRTPEERRRNASKAGKASVEARRKRKALKEQMLMLLELPVQDSKAFNKMSAFGIDISEIDNNTRLVYCLLLKAFSGDVAAIKEVRSMIGEDTSADVMAKLDEMISMIDNDAKD